MGVTAGHTLRGLVGFLEFIPEVLCACCLRPFPLLPRLSVGGASLALLAVACAASLPRAMQEPWPSWMSGGPVGLGSLPPPGLHVPASFLVAGLGLGATGYFPTRLPYPAGPIFHIK